MNSTQQRKAGVVLSYISQFILILSGMVYTPVMLRLLGQSEYGLYQLSYSVVSYLSLLSLGFGSSYMRFHSRYKVENNGEEIARLNGMFLTIFLGISLICILAGAALVLNAGALLGNGLTEAEVGKSKILMAFMVFNMALSFPNSAIDCTITAKEQFIFQRSINVAQAILNPCITLPILIMGYGSVGMVCVSTSLTLIKLIINTIFTRRKLYTKFIFRGFRFGLLKEMGAFTFFIFLNMIFTQINHTIDKFLLGRYMSTVAVAVYSVADNLYNMYSQVSTAISGVFIPKINFLVAEGNNDEQLTDLMIRVGRVQFILVSLIILGFMGFGKSFIAIWAGSGYEESYRIAMMLMLASSVSLIQNIGIEIQRAKNKHQIRSIVYVIITVANIFISIPCIQIWGISGAALGTAISLVAGTWIFMNYYYQKGLGLNMIRFWKSIAQFIPALIIPCVISVILKKYVVTKSVIYLGVGALLYTFIFAIFMWKLAMNNEEKKLITSVIDRMKKGGKR